MTSSAEHSEAVQIRARFMAQLGKKKLAEKIGALTGYSRPQVFRWFNDGFPPAAIIVLEFLEKTPQEEWPPAAKAAVAENF